jgi:hypothetical protein
MNPYKYSISLRASHPSKDLAFLSDVFSLERRHGWTVGDDRVTPKGNKLGGSRTESYWSAPLVPADSSSDEVALAGILEQSARQLINLAPQLADFHSTGGTLNYFVGLFGDASYGLVLSAGLMQLLSQAKVELQLDIYPCEQAD